MEAVIILDVLRRAGCEVVSAGMRPGPVTASRGVRLLPDSEWNKLVLAAFDALMLPGGTGARSLASDSRVLEAVRSFARAGKWVGAICAAPLVLKAAGVLDGIRFTCHPSVATEMGPGRLEERVVADGRILTSQGPGTAFEFALAMVERLKGAAAAKDVAAPMLLPQR